MDKIIYRDKLEKSKQAEDYALTLEKMFEDVVMTPHFEDEDQELEIWSLSWFHKETKDEIEWTIVVCLLEFINSTGYKVSHVLTNETFKKHAEVHEAVVLGKQVQITNTLDSLIAFDVEINESGL